MHFRVHQVAKQFRLAVLATGLCCTALPAPRTPPGIAPPNVSVGSNLQASATIALTEPAPEGGIEITLTSSDPSRLLLSTSPETAGLPSIVIPVRERFRESPEFWLQGFGDSGTVTYTASAPGVGRGNGTVTLTPSAIMVAGPYRGPSFPTTPAGEPSRITLYVARLDKSLEYAEQQTLAGGKSIDVRVTSSNDNVGTVTPSSVTITGGLPSAVVDFVPKGAGETTITVAAISGFSVPAQFAKVAAVVRAPGIGLPDQLVIGQNLQLGGIVGLGEAAPDGGVKVTLTSENPKQLLLSPASSDVGAASISIAIPPGEVRASFFLQALGRSGTVKYTASADGFVSRTATVVLAPSGVVITPSDYGPPDEAELLREDAAKEERGFVSSLARPEKMALVVWTLQLDPVTHRGADVTVQPLRAGMDLNVEVKCSDPAVGSVVSPVLIKGGTDHAGTHFMPLRVGSTEILVIAPEEFTKAANATSVKAIVKK